MQSSSWFLERVQYSEHFDLNRNVNIYTIGRGKENLLICPSLYVSRKHCVIKERADKLFILDLESANGTYVNNTRIISSRDIPLESGDVLGIGVSEVLTSDCYIYKLLQVKSESLPDQLHPSTSAPVKVSIEIIELSDSEEFSDNDNSDVEHISSSVQTNEQPVVTLTTCENISIDGKCRVEDTMGIFSAKEQIGITMTNCEETSVKSKGIEAVTSSSFEEQPRNKITSMEKTLIKNEVSRIETVISSSSEEWARNKMANRKETAVDCDVVSGNKAVTSSSSPKEQSNNAMTNFEETSVQSEGVSRTKAVTSSSSSKERSNNTKTNFRESLVQSEGVSRNKAVTSNSSMPSSLPLRKEGSNLCTEMLKAEDHVCHKSALQIEHSHSEHDVLSKSVKKPISKVNCCKDTVLNKRHTTDIINHDSATETHTHIKLMSSEADPISRTIKEVTPQEQIEHSPSENDVLSKSVKKPNSEVNDWNYTVMNKSHTTVSLNHHTTTETHNHMKLMSKEADEIQSTTNVTPQEMDVIKQTSNTVLPNTPASNEQCMNSTNESLLKTERLNENISSAVSSLILAIRQPTVQLKRLDTKYLQSYFQESSSSDALKYTMEDDIVVISDEDDCDGNGDDNKNKETIGKTSDEFNCCEVEEDENEGEFESDSDNEWWPKLSQSFLDEIELEETIVNNSNSLKRSVSDDSDNELFNNAPKKRIKRHNRPIIMSDDESSKDSITSNVPSRQGGNAGIMQLETKDEFEDTDNNAFKKMSNLGKGNNKQHVGPRRTLIIDAQPLPPRRYQRTSIETKATSKIISEVEKTHSTFKEEKKIKQKRSRSGSGDSDQHQSSSLSKKDKKSITAERKEKLKAIASQKKSEGASTSNANKVKVKVRVKNTAVSRGDILVEDLIPSKTKGNVSASTSTSSMQSTLPVGRNGRSNSNKTPCVKDILHPINTSVPQSKAVPNTKGNEVNTESKVPKKLSVKDLPRIPRIRDETSCCNIREATIQNKPETLSETTSCLPVRTEIESTNTRKSCIPALQGSKRRVHFKSDELCEIRYIPIEDNAQLRPVALIKDAPLNRNTNHNRPKLILPKSSLEQVIHAICNWNTKWLQEQKELSRPPPCHGKMSLYPMLTSFSSYGDYFKVVNPLMLLDLWAKLCQEFERPRNQSRRHPHNVIMESIVDDTSSKLPLMKLKCHVLLSNHDINTNHVPFVADLCILVVHLDPSMGLQGMTSFLESDSQGTTQCARIFAYIESTNKEPHFPSHNAFWGNDNNNRNIAWKVSMILKLKCNYYVKHNTKLKLMVLANIRPDLRTFEAVIALSHCKLSNHILNPVIEDYALPPVDINRKLVLQDTLNASQRKAVLQSADVCLKADPKICLIQGPPGTGKSTVITNIIMQILYGKNQYQKTSRKKDRPRILVCAPSNAAVDELVCRLLQIRRTFPKEERFKMVRTGRMDMMRPMVQDISLEDLSRRDVRQCLQDQEGLESVAVEISNLEAKRRSYEMTLESAQKRQSSTANILKKISDVDKKLLQLKNINHGKVDPRKRVQMERESQVKLLAGADIVASTLSSCFTALMSEVFATSGEDTQFTCCIVDEATQCCEPEALVPLMLGINTFVLVGDPEQLQATVVSKEAQNYGFGQSLFNRLWKKFGHNAKSPVHFLDIQYRMHPEICRWPNEYVYTDRIKSAPLIESIRDSPLMPYIILSLDFKQLSNGETVNPKEAKLVSELALGIQNLGQYDLKVAIITPYQKQRSEITRHLRYSVHSSSNLEVNTIDSFQGQECDVVILSCVRTEGVGFMTDTQRLNVALTRAKFSLIICGNFVSLRKDAMWADLLRNASARSLIVNVNCTEVPSKEELLRFVLRRS